MKTCSCCLITKPATEFYRHDTGKDGLSGNCKECKRSRARVYARERYYSDSPRQGSSRGPYTKSVYKIH